MAISLGQARDEGYSALKNVELLYLLKCVSFQKFYTLSYMVSDQKIW